MQPQHPQHPQQIHNQQQPQQHPNQSPQINNINHNINNHIHNSIINSSPELASQKENETRSGFPKLIEQESSPIIVKMEKDGIPTATNNNSNTNNNTTTNTNINTNTTTNTNTNTNTNNNNNTNNNLNIQSNHIFNSNSSSSSTPPISPANINNQSPTISPALVPVITQSTEDNKPKKKLGLSIVIPPNDGSNINSKLPPLSNRESNKLTPINTETKPLTDPLPSPRDFYPEINLPTDILTPSSNNPYWSWGTPRGLNSMNEALGPLSPGRNFFESYLNGMPNINSNSSGSNNSSDESETIGKKRKS
ncbi:hypothetical protein DICPUDRAFT_160206 [Dictyostelium purpureum]|uniref:Uncharacterized protein n=1 Tax=Dictyostelium purpureum TaxID=5786 RepID=F1A5X4_DICPU|nr:uncharacterized protein DICPUDRAFT_160206 [Dictyostelium purpureum]EGC28404.1 hypothetical protein DICPUDRAFT_160206 [Dictyostelium purpureum]|eukprot:XP_003295068.1 hypothetical protein DICPUDRAFT_160206 [Dictyostelium purpureum]